MSIDKRDGLQTSFQDKNGNTIRVGDYLLRDKPTEIEVNVRYEARYDMMGNEKPVRRADLRSEPHKVWYHVEWMHDCLTAQRVKSKPEGLPSSGFYYLNNAFPADEFEVVGGVP